MKQQEVTNETLTIPSLLFLRHPDIPSDAWATPPVDSEEMIWSPVTENRYAAAMSSLRDRVFASIRYRRFLAINVWAFLLFPVTCIALTLCFWDEDHKIATLLVVYSLTHLGVLWFGVNRFGHAHRLQIPSLGSALAIFLYNRHVPGFMDDSPFSNGIELEAARIFGLTGYLRVLDKPSERFGVFYFDGAGLSINVELLVFVIFVLMTISSTYDWLAAAIKNRRSAHVRP